MSSIEIASMIKKNEISCYQVITIFINQIIKYDNQLNALAYDCFAEAKEIARFYDKKYNYLKKKNNIKKLPTYFGVPIIIKESIELKDKPFTFGYSFRQGFTGQSNNEYCQKLINNGFIILGAGNVAEGCTWIETDNKIYGRTNNPYDLERTPGGSSGGTAALITTNCSPIGLCNDAQGSIRIPAYYNCLFGHKPTGGCIKGYYSDINETKFLDDVAQSGIVSRQSNELWPIISLLSDTNKIKTNQYDNLKLQDVTFIYIGDSFKNFLTTDIDSTLNNKIDDVLNLLKDLNCESKSLNLFELELSSLIILSKLSKNKDIHSCDIYLDESSISQNFLDLNFINFGMKILSKLLKKYTNEKNEEENLIDKIFKILEVKIKGLLKSDNNVILVCPTLPNLPPYHNTSIKHFFDIPMVGIWNLLKLPVTQVPLGLNYQGLPLGFQLIGDKYKDRLTIKVAELLEKEGIAKWVQPKIIK